MCATINISHEPQDGIVAATVKGKLTVGVAHKTIGEMVEVSAEHDTQLLLVDVTNAKLEASTTDIYYLPSQLVNLGLTPGHRQALVVSQDRRDHDFMETVSNNRGLRIKVFEDSEKAKSWLKGCA